LRLRQRKAEALFMASDPRVYFAAERTLLAWVRTGITVIGFGFLVARFGLFLDLLAAEHVQVRQTMGSATPWASTAVGVGLVLMGSAAMMFAAWQHRGYVATLPESDLPPNHSRRFPIVVTMVLGLLGMALAGYLMV
jgi:putative membrane protein